MSQEELLKGLNESRKKWKDSWNEYIKINEKYEQSPNDFIKRIRDEIKEKENKLFDRYQELKEAYY